MSLNERLTENLVRDALRDLGYYLDQVDTIVEEQKSQIEKVVRLLKNASKTGGWAEVPRNSLSALLHHLTC